MATSDHPVYEALALPNEALNEGGTEILRAGVIADELYVVARRAFHDPAQWGEVLADIVQRLAILYSAETDLTEQEVITEIESAFAAELGAPLAKPARRKPAPKRAKAKAKTSNAKTSKAKTTRAAPSRAKTARAKPRAKRK
jgi:hypothetical protein